MTAAWIAEGLVHHHRHEPVEHAFSYRTGWLLMDLERAAGLLDRGWWSAWGRPGLQRFHRADFLAGKADLAEAVRDRVQAHLGQRPTGRVRLLTTCRMAGWAFNPVSFYFCDHGGRLAALVAEITNTPWGERFAYVLPVGAGDDHRFTFPKAFHVSPFWSMHQEYRWRLRLDDRRILIHMENHEDGQRVFEATLALTLVPASPSRLFRFILARPLAPVRVLGAIYLQALRLWWRRAPFHPHPKAATC